MLKSMMRKSKYRNFVAS